MQIHRRKIKARFNTNTQTISEKLFDLDDRVNHVNELYTILDDQVDGFVHTIPNLRAELDRLKEDVKSIAPREADIPDTAQEAALVKHAGVKASISTLDKLVNGQSHQVSYFSCPQSSPLQT